jgi:hypothetical protein
VPQQRERQKPFGDAFMKMIAEYLQKAQEFERFAASEKDAKRKVDLLSQAEAYRNLAAKRAKDRGLSIPSDLKS